MSVYIRGAAYSDGAKQDATSLDRQLRRADAFIRQGALAVMALQRLLPEDTGVLEEHCGLFLGTAHGPMPTTFTVLDQMMDKEPVSPTLFSQSLFNAAVGQLAQLFGLRGPSFTVTDFAFPFYRAMQQAYCSLASGWVSDILVLQVESYSPLLVDAREKSDPGSPPPVPGAFAMLLTNRPAAGCWHIDNLQLTVQQAPPATLLRESETMTVNGTTHRLGSLHNCRRLAEDICSSRRNGLDVHLQAEYGEVWLALSS